MSRHRWGLLGLFALALGLRLAAIDWTNAPPSGDGPLFDDLAVNLLQGEGFARPVGSPTAWVTPGYPLWLAGIYAVAGQRQYDAVRAAQAVLGAATCVWIAWLGWQLWNRPVGWIAGGLCAVHPFLIQAGTLLLTETVFLGLLTALIVLWVRAAQTNRLRDVAGMALLCAWATLTRPVFAIFPAGWLVWWIARHRWRWSRPLATQAVVFLLVWLAPIAAWTWRNYRVFHAFVPLATQSGDVFYISYHPVQGKVLGAREDDDPVMHEANATFPRSGLSEPARSRFLFQAGVRSIREHPERLPYLLALKAMTFWSVFDWEILGQGRYNVGTAVLLPLMILGAVIWWKRRQPGFGFVGWPILYLFAMGLIFYGLPRFRLTVEPLLVLLAGVGVWWLWSRTSRQLVVAGGLLAWLGLNVLVLRHAVAVRGACRLALEHLGLW